MTSELTNLATRLRGFITSSTHVGCQEEEFEAFALELFKFQFAHNAPYRRVCEARGMSPGAVKHWTQIPAVPTSAFKEFDLSCLAPAERTNVFHSSGTTGQQPSRHFHSAESLAVYEASLWPWFARHLLADSKTGVSRLRLLVLTPPPAQAPHSSLVHMFEVLRRRLGAEEGHFTGRVDEGGSWRLDLDSTNRAMECSQRDGRPLLLFGTAFSFVHLMDSLAQMNLQFQLPTASRVMETGGYKGRSRSLPKAELHALIARRLGVLSSHIVCEYGMSELSSQAYDSAIRKELTPNPSPGGEQNAHRTMAAPLLAGVRGGPAGTNTHLMLDAKRTFHFPPWSRVQIISPETNREVEVGETGLIRVFDLANVFSVLAIQTEDLALRRADGFELLGRAPLAEPRGCSLMAIIS